MKSLFVAIAVALSFRLMYAAARRHKPTIEEGKLIFPAATAFKALLWGGLALWTFAVLFSHFVHWADMPWWAQLIFLTFLLLTPFGFPPLLTIGEDGLNRRYWFGPSSTFPWHEIAKIEFYPASFATKVVAANGKKIWHSGFHVGSQQFRTEVQKRTQLPISVRRPGFIGTKTTQIQYPDGRVESSSGSGAAGA